MLRLKSFRLKNFRSVHDSGECHVASDVSIFAGKNESGKSAILDGIELLLTTEETTWDPADRTVDEEENPTLETCFELTQGEAEALGERMCIPVLQERTVHIVWEVDDFSVTGPAVTELVESAKAIMEKTEKETLSTAQRALKAFGQSTLPHSFEELIDFLGLADEADSEEDSDADAEDEEDVRTVEMEEDDAEDGDDEQSEVKIDEELEPLKHLVGTILARKNDLLDIDSLFGELVPPVILFRSFEDELPDHVTVTDKDSVGKRIVKDFCALSNLDVEKLANKNLSKNERQNLVEKASYVYSSRFGRFWRQEPITVRVNVDGDSLVFLVKDPQEPHLYAPSQRSKGLRWYTSFFITLTARKGEHDGGLILIDEPGLYLHSAAQRDLLQLLEEMAQSNYQVAIATHSPYLLRADRLDRVRLVIKHQETNRTRVYNAWYRGADKETISPVITAIGLDHTAFPGINRLNVVVEGPADYYLLQAMRMHLERLGMEVLPPDLAIVPCLGHANVGLIVSILTGWGFECAVVFDKKGTKRMANILQLQGVPDERVIRVGHGEDDSVADLFSANDVKQYILPPDTVLVEGEKVSKQTKKVPRTSEIIMARRFLDAVVQGKQIELTKTTVKHFEQLFGDISRAFAAADQRRHAAAAVLGVDSMEGDSLPE